MVRNVDQNHFSCFVSNWAELAWISASISFSVAYGGPKKAGRANGMVSPVRNEGRSCNIASHCWRCNIPDVSTQAQYELAA